MEYLWWPTPLHLDAKANGRIVADRQRITQAIMNLAQNATQHTTDGDIIALGFSLTDSDALFWVRDTGEGIALTDQKRIFERFARGSSGRRRGSEGAGLGLAIVRGKSGSSRQSSGTNKPTGWWLYFHNCHSTGTPLKVLPNQPHSNCRRPTPHCCLPGKRSAG